ncbi:MAG: MMPL family transporter, partial [Proteobacteria bacterium]|nr:MMPL family transporter [Pseudomonadota bacterium]
VKLAAQNIIEEMFLPGFIGILADALGVAVVAIATIPILEKIAISCTVWLVGTIILSLIFTPILLSYTPASERFTRLAEKRSRKKENSKAALSLRGRFLALLGTWIPKRGKWYILIATIVITAVGWTYAQQIIIGDFFPGSSILWPFDRYNKDAFRIAFSMPLLNPLYVVVEGEQGGSITQASTLRGMDKFQRYVAKHERVMFVNSLVSSLPNFMMSSFEDDPQWNHLAREDKMLSFSARQMTYVGAPGTWDQYVNMKDTDANIIIYCRDKMPKTVESIMNYITDYVKKNPLPEGVKFVLAGGAVGVQAAVRDVIADAQIWNLIIALGGVFLFCAINFKSVMAGLILTIPLAISNILTFALMGAYSIGLTTNTYPVSSIGIGLGVDYGIYFVGRLLEERKKGAGLNEALFTTMTTNGVSIIQIATILTIGLVMWVFSPMKFQAEMGVLLAILLLLNMLGALLLVPAMICIFKPRFVK